MKRANQYRVRLNVTFLDGPAGGSAVTSDHIATQQIISNFRSE